MRRFGISFLSSLIKLLSGVKIYDVTSGFRAVNRSMIAFFAENYPQDYPEPDAILLSTLEGFRLVEVPAQMRERVGGQSSISSFRAVYYMVKVSISLIVSRLSHKRRKIK